MTTIYDIAKQTGFAPATVSKTLNNYYGVKKETREVILSAARDMGYTPNTAARSLTTKKTWLVGVLFSEEVYTGISHTHFGAILASAQSRLAEAGYDVVFISNKVSGKKVSYIEHCNSRGVEGVIVAASAPFTDSVRCVLESDVKMVSVETVYKGKYTVLSDNKKGTEQALSYLYSLGHRHIGYISCPHNSTAGSERNRAFGEFMRSMDLPLRDEWNVETKTFSVMAGYEAAKELMENCADKPTSVFVGYGEAAVGVMNYLEERNYRVPDDISIIGFDNIEMAVARGLTTICQARAGIGELAAELLIGQIEGKEIPYPFDNRLETLLIERTTCGRI